MTLNSDIGRLEKVDLREIWPNEFQDFTPWLAKSENLTMLSNTLSMELELGAKEQSVGPYRADILCKDLLSQNWVVIENQLNKTESTLFLICTVKS